MQKIPNDSASLNPFIPRFLKYRHVVLNLYKDKKFMHEICLPINIRKGSVSNIFLKNRKNFKVYKTIFEY